MLFIKLKNQKGSAMSLAIVLTVLVSIVGGSITMMVNNQIKFSTENSKNTELKYNTETGIEEVIGKFIEEIDVTGEDTRLTGFNNILTAYIELADILVKSSGLVDDNIIDSEVNRILNNLKEGTITRSDMNSLVIKLGALDGLTGSNLSGKEIAQIGKEYAMFFRDNFFKGEELNLDDIDVKKAKDFISIIIKNLSLEEFTVTRGKYAGRKDNGNVGIVYRDITIFSEKGNLFNVVYQSFNKSSTNNITSKIKKLTKLTTTGEINEWINTNINSEESIIDTIKSTNYTTNIDEEILLINKGSYLNEQEIKHFYDTTGNVTYKDIVSKRLTIVKKEIDMLIQWLEAIKGRTPDNIVGGDSTSESSFKISVPKQVILKDEANEVKKTISITPVIETQDVELVTPGTDSNRYEFKILQNSLGTKIVLTLKIQSKVDDYTIESDVDIKICDIVNINDYKVEYEIKNWDKKIN